MRTRQGQCKEGGGQRRVRRGGGEGTGKVDKTRLLQPLKSLVVVVKKVIIVSVHILYFSFSLCQTRGVVRNKSLHRLTSVYVGLRRWVGTWSLTIFNDIIGLGF